LSDYEQAGWHNPEELGRWTQAEARLFLDTADTFQTLEIEAANTILSHKPSSSSMAIAWKPSDSGWASARRS
jgi:hypothetical protein